MAGSRKKPPESTISLFGATPAPKAAPAPVPKPQGPPPELPTDTPVVAERKIRLVHSAPEEDVTIEPAEGGDFWVSTLRHYGGTRTCVLYTRKQLQMLQRRISAALEIGDAG